MTIEINKLWNQIDWKSSTGCAVEMQLVSQKKKLTFVTKALHIEVELLTSIEKEDEDVKSATCM